MLAAVAIGVKRSSPGPIIFKQRRYGLDGKPPRTLEEISKHIGRTRERVRQIQKRALKKLRSQIGDDYQDVHWRRHWRNFN